MRPDRLLLGGFMVLLLVVPAVLSPYYVTLLNYIGLYAMVALGLVLLTGVGGLTSFGQAAFVGLGAYTTAWLTTVHGVSPWLTLFIGMALTAAVALSLGFITLRMGGHYLPLPSPESVHVREILAAVGVISFLDNVAVNTPGSTAITFNPLVITASAIKSRSSCVIQSKVMIRLPSSTHFFIRLAR